MVDFRAERGKVMVRGHRQADGSFALGGGRGPETPAGLREAWRLRRDLSREQGAADPLPGVILKAALQRAAVWHRWCVRREGALGVEAARQSPAR